MEVDTIEEPRKKARTNNNGAVVVKRTRGDLTTRNESALARRKREANKAYGRGEGMNTKNIRDKKLRRNMKNLESKYETAALRAKDAEILLEHQAGFLEPEGEMERTYKVRQEDIVKDVAVETAQKRFELKLDALGPYSFDYTRNGRELLLGGRKGHVATMDWREGKLGCELQLGETVRDVKWLHNNQFFAVSQKKNVYIYDRDGVEVHSLRKFTEVSHMQFLPYHYLLGTLSITGMLRYLDTSTGDLVAEIPTRLGQPVSFGQNRYNAILHAGHQNGTVTLWSPNSSEPLVKLLAHRGPVRALDMDREGRYMVTAGQDQRMAVWDIRMFKEVHNYHTHQPASSISISDTGLTAVGWGTQTTIWKGLFDKNKPVQEKVQSPYMAWSGEGRRLERVQWCPFEDVLGMGHEAGFSSIIVPGAGEANFDALEANPFENKKQRQESEVKGLLNKLRPEMIALNPDFVGNLDLRSDKQRQAEKDLDAAPMSIEEDIRNRARGRNGALSKYLRKQRKKNIIDEKRLKVDEIWKERQDRNQKKLKQQEDDLGPALSRFAKRE